MSDQNKAVLNQANAAILAKDHEEFLSYCTDDTQWHFLGDKTLKGKDAVRQWLDETYTEPPTFKVDNLIAEGDYLAAYGEITVKSKDGTVTCSSYCDVWRFQNGKLAELKAYVVEK